jgi:hypothetical protein
MPKKKAPEPEPVEEGVPVEEQFEKEGGAAYMDKEGLQHLMKGATEIMMAMEQMIPKRQMSPEVKLHAKNVKREMLLLARAMLDVKIKECDEEEKEAPTPKLKKIKLD